MRAISLVSSLFALLSIPSSTLAQLTFVQIGREFTGGMMWLDPDVFPALSEDGTVAFVASDDFDVFDGTRVFVGDGGPLTELDFTAAGLSTITALAVNDQGQVMIGATRSGAPGYRGVYTTTVASGAFSTFYEGELVMPEEGNLTPVKENAAMSQNGTIAFSTIVNGAGAIYRGHRRRPSVTAARATSTTRAARRERCSSGAVQLEYGAPTPGLSARTPVFETPAQALGSRHGMNGCRSSSAQPWQPPEPEVALLNGTLTMASSPPGVFGPVYEEVCSSRACTSSIRAVEHRQAPTLIAGNGDG